MWYLSHRAEEIGGTWRDNTYPGAACDVPSHLYSYSFEQNPDWSDYFSRRDELETYVVACARKYGVERNVQLETEVLSAAWDDEAAVWNVDVRRSDGREERLVANALVSAVGMLNRPQLPDIAGLGSFEGPCFHSARWDASVELAGKRVGVVGTGASAMQFVPPTAQKAAKLTIFQRAAHWATFNAAYRQTVSDGFKWLLRHVPHYHSWYRFLLFWTGADRVYPVFRIEPDRLVALTGGRVLKVA